MEQRGGRGWRKFVGVWRNDIVWHTLHPPTHMRRIEPPRRSTRWDEGCAPLYAWGPAGLRSGSLPAFWARAGWESLGEWGGGPVGGWGGGPGEAG